LLDAEHARDARRGQERAQGDSGAATVRRDAAPTAPHLPDDPRHRPAHDRAFLAVHPAFEPCGALGPPLEGHSPPSNNEGDGRQGWGSFHRPVASQTGWPVRQQLAEDLQEPRIGSGPQRQALVGQQGPQPLGGGFLLAPAAGPWGLTAGLLVHKGSDNVPAGFALMAIGPGHHSHAIIVETSGRSVLSSTHPRRA